MKRRDLLGASLGALLSLPASAHRLNVFAWEEGGKIHVEAKFSNGKGAQGARVGLYQGETLVQETQTDEKGTATLSPALQEKLSVRVLAPGGHLGQTPLLAPAARESPLGNTAQVVLERAQYEALLASAKPRGAGLVEIVGGMGWLVGLSGFLAFWRSKKK